MSGDNVIPPAVWNDRWKREDLLVRRPRIRRDREMPTDLSRDLAVGYRYPYRLKCELAGYEVHYRRGRWHNINEGAPAEDGYDTSSNVRETVAWIMDAGERVGAISFAEYDPPFAGEEDFCQCMDDESEHMGRLAEICCSTWEQFTLEVAGFGPVVELRSVWLKPRSVPAGTWRPALDALLRKLTAKSSILVVHAFPLEYEGRAAPGDASRLGFRRRQAAMVRWCERHLQLRRFPGPPGEDGWLWRPRRRAARHLYEPGWNPNWRDTDA